MNADFADKGTSVRFASIRAYSRRLCVLVLCGLSLSASAQTQKAPHPEKSISYQIKLSLDFDSHTYTGVEKVLWINRGDHATSTLFFHLYPNMRPPGYSAPTTKNEAGQIISDEPRLDVTDVRVAANNAPAPFSRDEQETTLRVNLREPVQPNQAVELAIKFKGSVPEIDPDETGLVT